MTALIIAVLALVSVLGVMYATLHSDKLGAGTDGNSRNQAQRLAVSYPKERVQRGEKIYKSIESKYKMPIAFTWMAKEILLRVPLDEWNKLSKEDQVNITLYAESLVPIVKAAPRKYIDEWKRQTGELETSDAAFTANVSGLCDRCWQLVIGKLAKDNGKFDVIEEESITGENADAFRQATDKKVVTWTEPAYTMTPAQYLAEAKKLLGPDSDAASDDNVLTAYSYLKAIPKSALEYKEAQILIPKIEARAKSVGMRMMEPYARKK
ncbi:MAG TPA: hypothetical protein VF546_13015 [Pyrinomonadaceae bacterium]|jgi:hypothetical protein